MRRLYSDQYSTTTRSLYRWTVDRGIDSYIHIDTPYKTQDPNILAMCYGKQLTISMIYTPEIKLM